MVRCSLTLAQLFLDFLMWSVFKLLYGSAGIVVDYFGWMDVETFHSFRTKIVVLAAFLRVYLLPECVQQQCLLSVLMVAKATPVPATLPAIQRLQAKILFVQRFTVGYACQFACPAIGLLAASLLLWRRTATDLGNAGHIVW